MSRASDGLAPSILHVGLTFFMTSCRSDFVYDIVEPLKLSPQASNSKSRKRTTVSSQFKVHFEKIRLRAKKTKGPFTHAFFNAISDTISRTKRALPYPARMLFSRSIAWIGKKVITYYLKTLFFPISANLTVFSRSVTRLKTRVG